MSVVLKRMHRKKAISPPLWKVKSCLYAKVGNSKKTVPKKVWKNKQNSFWNLKKKNKYNNVSFGHCQTLSVKIKTQHAKTNIWAYWRAGCSMLTKTKWTLSHWTDRTVFRIQNKLIRTASSAAILKGCWEICGWCLFTAAFLQRWRHNACTKHGARFCKGYLLLISFRNKSVFNYSVSCKELLHLTKTCCSFFFI